MGYRFYKEKPSDQVWWIDDLDRKGQFLFSFDRKRVFNLFRDYPHELTPDQKEAFDRECPFWKDFFKDRPYKPQDTQEIQRKEDKHDE